MKKQYSVESTVNILSAIPKFQRTMRPVILIRSTTQRLFLVAERRIEMSENHIGNAAGAGVFGVSARSCDRLSL